MAERKILELKEKENKFESEGADKHVTKRENKRTSK